MSSQAGQSSRRHPRGHKSSKASSKEPRHRVSGESAVLPEPSFLFIVNEFHVNYEPVNGQNSLLYDQWGNVMPVVRPEAYEGEMVGTVFRYKRGSVSPAKGYTWFRPAPHEEGYIVRVNAESGSPDGEFSYPTPYKAKSIFACSAHLPIVIADSDASLGLTYMRKNCPCGDCDGQYDYEGSLYSPWWTLFFSDGDGAVSKISPWGSPFVAGNNPSWIPSLVPKQYNNNQARAHSAQRLGLGGDLPVVIGLMAFHGRVGRASEIFRERWWSACRWNGNSSAPSNCKPVNA